MKQIEEIAFLITARLTSERIPRKMIRPFGNSNLFEIAIDKLQSSLLIPKSSIFVSVFDQELIEIANRKGVGIHQRSEKSVTSEAQSVAEVFDWWDKLPSQFKYVILLNGCHPMLQVSTIDNFVKQYLNTSKDGQFAVIKRGNYFFNKDKLLTTPIPDNRETFDTKVVETTYEAAHALYASRLDTIGDGVWMGSFKKNDVELFEISETEAYDIDEPWQFEHTQALYKEFGTREHSRNKDLKERYNQVFAEGSENFFTCNLFEESMMIMTSQQEWKGKNVLEIGCGKGNLASMMAYAGAKVYAIDYSDTAIDLAKQQYNLPNLTFECRSFKELPKQEFDIVVMQGTLEHFDKPFEDLDFIINNFVKEDGQVITTSPNFTNLRGAVWMTLQLLFDIPMSLTDLHFLIPSDFQDYCKDKGHKLEEVKSGYQDWGNGKTLIRDYRKRLVNALRDAGHLSSTNKVPKLLDWLEKVQPYFTQTELSGAMACYSIRKGVKPFEFGDKPFIIAEGGINHNGNLDLAKQLIDIAKEGGADCIKFQKRDPDALFTKDFANQKYNNKNAYGETYLKHKQALELSKEQFKELKRYADSKDILFSASGWDKQSVDFLDSLGVPFFKMASADLTNLPLLEHTAKKGKPMLISTGMANLEMVNQAVKTVQKWNSQIVLMQCTSTYPCSENDINLNVLKTFANEFPNVVLGYSGHETGTEISIGAVVMGARVIERHITLDKNLKGNDHASSLDANELKRLVNGIRSVYKALGTCEKEILESEKGCIKKLRKSLVSTNDIPKGTVVERKHLTVKGPGDGISPLSLNEVLGKTSKQFIPADSVLKWSHF